MHYVVRNSIQIQSIVVQGTHILRLCMKLVLVRQQKTRLKTVVLPFTHIPNIRIGRLYLIWYAYRGVFGDKNI